MDQTSAPFQIHEKEFPSAPPNPQNSLAWLQMVRTAADIQSHSDDYSPLDLMLHKGFSFGGKGLQPCFIYHLCIIEGIFLAGIRVEVSQRSSLTEHFRTIPNYFISIRKIVVLFVDTVLASGSEAFNPTLKYKG